MEASLLPGLLSHAHPKVVQNLGRSVGYCVGGRRGIFLSCLNCLLQLGWGWGLGLRSKRRLPAFFSPSPNKGVHCARYITETQAKVQDHSGQ